MNLILPIPIQLIFKSEDKKTVYTRCSILEIFETTGLGEEAFGDLLNLTFLVNYTIMLRVAFPSPIPGSISVCAAPRIWTRCRPH